MKLNEQPKEKNTADISGNATVNRVGLNAYINGAYQPAGDTGDKDKNNPVLEMIGESSRTEIKPTHGRSTLEKICLAFSAYSNGVKILSTEQGAGSLGALHGIRFLSMAWVILGHTLVYSGTVSAEEPFVLRRNFCRGVLVAYLALRELKKVGGAKRLNWFIFYFHRFWRLTPPYMLVIMVGTVLLPYAISGPFWPEGDLSFMAACRKNWWTNLLYCMGWSWYLANDMQFYIISPLILLPLFYNIFAGAACGLVLLAASITATWIISSKHEYSAQANYPYAPYPKDGDYGKTLYTPSYARICPYIIGLFVGYILYRTRCKIRIPKTINILGWFLSLAVFCTVTYSLYTDKRSHILSLHESAAYFSLHRTGWGLAMAWVIVACCTGYGGWINELLSWRGFIPLSRLTYCAYLIHPLVMLTFYMNRRQLTYFTQFELVYLFVGHLTMSYGLSFIVSLVFEAPMMGLEKAVLRKRK
ncbi:NRF6-like protein [Mya arenaria]|uniref:NRF6-like protein n=1 Tax=Mya arenaria TaxID=6604 RepID=A0ABY7EVV9_MYAAR|nr:NRF6-like protein [Mya arenaria]